MPGLLVEQVVVTYGLCVGPYSLMLTLPAMLESIVLCWCSMLLRLELHLGAATLLVQCWSIAATWLVHLRLVPTNENRLQNLVLGVSCNSGGRLRTVVILSGKPFRQVRPRMAKIPLMRTVLALVSSVRMSFVR